MIFKDRSWGVGNPKCAGYNFHIRCHPERKSGEIVVCEGTGFISHHHYTEEELLDMLAILRKVKKEKREDKI